MIWDEIAVLAYVAKRLEAVGIDYMLTGSMALAFFAIPRMTRDIDIVIALDRENLGDHWRGLRKGMA